MEHAEGESKHHGRKDYCLLQSHISSKGTHDCTTVLQNVLFVIRYRLHETDGTNKAFERTATIPIALPTHIQPGELLNEMSQ